MRVHEIENFDIHYTRMNTLDEILSLVIDIRNKKKLDNKNNRE